LWVCISHYHDVYCCSHSNDAEQFFEKMEQKDADTYGALMVGLYKVCVMVQLLRIIIIFLVPHSIGLMIKCLVYMKQ